MSEKGLRAIMTLVLAFKALTENLSTDASEEHSCFVCKKARKQVKSITKAKARSQLVTGKHIQDLHLAIYGSQDKDGRALNEALSIKFKSSVFSEKLMMDKLIYYEQKEPDYEAESNLVMAAMKIKADDVTGNDNKEIKKLVGKIRAAIKEDMSIKSNSDAEMRKRRAIYAHWVSKGATAKMAEHFEVCYTHSCHRRTCYVLTYTLLGMRSNHRTKAPLSH
jgi:hypothetical protein